MSAAALLAEARAAGVTLRLVDGKPKVSGSPSPELLARLRAAKPELVGILTGKLCRHCARPVDYPGGGAVAFADDTGAHLGCDEQAEITRLLLAGHRAVGSLAALADPAEIGLEGRPLP